MKMAWDICGFSVDAPSIKHYAIATFEAVIPDYTLRDSTSGKDAVSKKLTYCSTHFRENISITSISEQFFMSRSTVSRIFSNKINSSFNDYINSLRIWEFLHLMQQHKYSITEAALLSGFPTIRTFNGAFKKRYGVTPSQYLRDSSESLHKTLSKLKM